MRSETITIHVNGQPQRTVISWFVDPAELEQFWASRLYVSRQEAREDAELTALDALAGEVRT